MLRLVLFFVLDSRHVMICHVMSCHDTSCHVSYILGDPYVDKQDKLLSSLRFSHVKVSLMMLFSSMVLLHDMTCHDISSHDVIISCHLM